jgi:RNA polymerase sigma factor (sigma-70 family)
MEARELGHFEVEWPELERWLRSVLTRRGVRAAAVDDLLQETAIRLYRMWDRIDERSPRALAWTIALNVAIDHHKKESRAQITHDIPDRASGLDVEAASIARIELARIKRALQELTGPQRAVLLADLGGGEAPEASPAATKMLRMRARRKLRLVLDGSKAGAFVFLVKRAVWRVARTMRSNVPVLEVPIGAVAGIAAATIAIAVPAITFSAPRASAAGVPGRQEMRLAGAEGLPEREIAAPETRTAARTRGPEAKVTSDHGGERTEVAIPEGAPVEGGASVEKRPDDDDIALPSCGVEQTQPNQFTVGCTIDKGSEEIDIDADLELRP